MDLERSPALAQGEAKRLPSAFVLPVYVAAVFVSALLLFAVQPMFTRMVLPRLGGAPSVWSVAMVFFQTMLLAGYAYAHLLTQFARPAVGVAIHLALLIAAAITLPLAIASGWGEPPSAGEALWLLGLFTVSIGLPFFALAANNPLLQAWFVKTGHPDAGNPYFLYAASNVGSFLALLSYPILLEPMLPLRAHGILWTAGFCGLIALIAACAYLMLSSPGAAARQDRQAQETVSPPRWAEIGRWVALSTVPSGLLVAVTAHISTDVAAAPLLWVIPLSLYLLTWVVVFQNRPVIPHRWMLRLMPFAIVALVALIALNIDHNLALNLGVHLATFFIVAMACHGELSRLKPHPRYLTTFYLSLSVGGMIGGVFSGLVAPQVFSWIAEYPILIVLAILCLPPREARPRGAKLFWPAAIGLGVLLLVPRMFDWVPTDAAALNVAYAIVAIAVASLLLVRTPSRFAFIITVALAMTHLYPFDSGRTDTLRSFFGVHKLRDTVDGRYRVLMHGTTIHGAQQVRDEAGRPIEGKPEPLTYYHDESPMAEALVALREAKSRPLKVAAIGLGAGSLACQIAPGDAWTFFEIDPDVIRIARDPNRFTFLQSCAPDVPIVLGDARLTLAREPDGKYDLVIVDAFSSDSIPVHLLTREAMAVYRAKVAPGGAIVMHVSNRHLELPSVVVGIAAANGLKTWVNQDDGNEERENQYIFSSTVAISAAAVEDIGALAEDESWEATEPEAGRKIWTDDYSNIIGALWRQHFE